MPGHEGRRVEPLALERAHEAPDEQAGLRGNGTRGGDTVEQDPDSFIESGRFARSNRPEVKHKTPADGKIAGFARIDGRGIALVSNDFTVLGASSSVINMKKIKHVKQAAAKRGMPLVLLGESSGARMPDRMGAAGRAIIAQDPTVRAADDRILRAKYLDWCSARVAEQFLRLTPDQIYELAQHAATGDRPGPVARSRPPDR